MFWLFLNTKVDTFHKILIQWELLQGGGIWEYGIWEYEIFFTIAIILDFDENKYKKIDAK